MKTSGQLCIQYLGGWGRRRELYRLQLFQGCPSQMMLEVLTSNPKDQLKNHL